MARGKVIPGKGNIFMLIHPRGHPAFMSAIGNVLRYGVTEATLFQQALRSCRKATRQGLVLFLRCRYTGFGCTVNAVLVRTVLTEKP